LEKNGFQQVNDVTELEMGDVLIFQPVEGHKYGHIEILGDHGIWYSDFVQKGMYPSEAYKKGSYNAYRWNNSKK
jgi:hypothetical protein